MAPVADAPPAGLEERVAAVMGVVNAATAELVELIAEADRTGAWQGWGIRSLDHWVCWRCGVSSHRARRLVSMARALPKLPAVHEVCRTGALSEDQATLACRHTTPATDTQVAEMAPMMTVAQLRRVLPSIPQPSPPMVEMTTEERQPEPTRTELRRVAFGWRDDGWWWLHAVLPPDEGAAVEAALLAARDAEFAGPAGPETTWSDALVRLANGDGESGSERYQVLVHVDADGDRPPAMHLGPLLPTEVAGLTSCDASIRAVLERSARPVGLGRRRRTVPHRLRVLIENRDGGCRVPGCERRRWLHVHHLVHWREGGATDPANLIALCSTHHRLVHFGRLRIGGDPDQPDGLSFIDERGRPLRPASARRTNGPPADAAVDIGLTYGEFRGPTGERLQTWAINWPDN
jgi:hypothetical protein